MNSEALHRLQFFFEAISRRQKRITAFAMLAFGLFCLQQDTQNKHPSNYQTTHLSSDSLTLSSEIQSDPFPLIIHVARFSDITAFRFEMSLREYPIGFEATSLPAHDWLEQSDNAIFAINGSFFQPVKDNPLNRILIPHNGINVFGQVIAQGREVSSPQLGFGVVCFSDQGHPSIARLQCPRDTETAFAGRTILLRDGEINQSLRATMRHPRLAIGFKGDEMIVVGVEGRHEGSIGVTLPDLAKIMQENGAEDAIELDGGGSMTLVYRNSEREIFQLQKLIDTVGPVDLPRDVFSIRLISR